MVLITYGSNDLAQKKIENFRVQKMASANGMGSDLVMLGDEWAPRKDTLEIIESFIVPFITTSNVVAEIGVGGGAHFGTGQKLNFIY